MFLSIKKAFNIVKDLILLTKINKYIIKGIINYLTSNFLVNH